jgi:NAD(P)-dependent dehydrogenase (short-subunit alcohol dehydrogenase family)
VAILDRNAESSQEVSRLVGGRALSGDVGDSDAVERAFEDLEGEAPVTRLVCAAGVARIAPFAEHSDTSFNMVMRVNAYGTFWCLRALATRRLKDRTTASAVVISSIDASMPVVGLAPYCAAKAAVEALVRSAAVELGRFGIRVNGVAPGLVETPLVAPLLADPEVLRQFEEAIPLLRPGKPQEVAEAVTYLLTTSYVNGHVMVVDGGLMQVGHPPLTPAG